MKIYIGIGCVFVFLLTIIYFQHKNNTALKELKVNLEDKLEEKESELCKIRDSYNVLLNNKKKINQEKQEDIFNEKQSSGNSLIDNFNNRLQLIQDSSL